MRGTAGRGPYGSVEGSVSRAALGRSRAESREPRTESQLEAPARSNPLDLDRDTKRRLGRRVADFVADHLAGLRDQPAWRPLGRAAAEASIHGPAPEESADFDELLAFLAERVFPYAVREPHPGFVAYVPGVPTFPAVLGDWLATGHNFFAGVWSVAGGPNQLELTVLEWFREWLGMPAGSGGLLTSGGSGATLTAVVAAREAAVGDDPSRLQRLAVYVSDQAHSACVRAAWIAGVPRAQVRVLPSDDDFRLPVPAVAEAVRRDRAAGLLPLMVVASAGTTNTGAVDALDGLADLCAAEGVWLHVDAAFGGFAVLTERGRVALAGIGRADSVTLDPHKWLFTPFECGSLMVRDPARLRAAFQVMPDYLRDVEARTGEVNFADYGEQLTRYARALKVWLGVRYFGLAALRRAIDGGIDRARLAERLVRARPELEVLAPATLGVLCFRARAPRGEDADARNERILAAVNAAGRHFISSTRVRGAFALRICPIGFRTTDADVERLVGEIAARSREEEGGGSGE